MSKEQYEPLKMCRRLWKVCSGCGMEDEPGRLAGAETPGRKGGRSTSCPRRQSQAGRIHSCSLSLCRKLTCELSLGWSRQPQLTAARGHLLPFILLGRRPPGGKPGSSPREGMEISGVMNALNTQIKHLGADRKPPFRGQEICAQPCLLPTKVGQPGTVEAGPPHLSWRLLALCSLHLHVMTSLLLQVLSNVHPLGLGTHLGQRSSPPSGGWTRAICVGPGHVGREFWVLDLDSGHKIVARWVSDVDS